MKADIDFLKNYIPKSELAALLQAAKGAEGSYFQELLQETETRIRNVPPIYANEELGRKAKVCLHYFGGATDYWITELDQETGEAFGYACINGWTDLAELGYSSIPEIVATDRLELDLYWDENTTLQDVMK